MRHIYQIQRDLGPQRSWLTGWQRGGFCGLISGGEATRAATNQHCGSVSPRVLQAQDGSMCENKYLVHPLTHFCHLVISSQDPHCGLQEWNKNETGLKEFGRGHGKSCIYLIIQLQALRQIALRRTLPLDAPVYQLISQQPHLAPEGQH